MKCLSRLAVLVFTVSVLGLSVVARAGSGLIEDLADEDYEVRQAATDALFLDESLAAEQLAGWYADAEDPEVRQRLLAIGRHHFLRQMRLERFPEPGAGAIGVVRSMQISPIDVNEPAEPDEDRRPITFVLVSRVLDGFPASGRLRPLDRVVAVDGQALGGGANNQRFEDLMARYRANQNLTLTVQRDDDTIDVVIPLASSDALASMYLPPEFRLAGDFADRWAEHRRAYFPPIDSNVAPVESDLSGS